MNEIDVLLDIWVIISSIVTIAALIAKYTPTQWDDEMLRRVKVALDFIAINPKPDKKGGK